MKQNKAKVYYILTGLVFVIGAGFSYMLFSGMESKVAEIAALKKDTRDPKELETELADLRDQRKVHAETLAHLEKGIPEIAYVPTMLKELETFGKQNGIDVRGVRPVPVAKDKKDKKSRPKPYNEVTIEIKGKGKYRAVMNFIAAIKNFPKIVAARTVSLTPKNDANNPNSGNLEVTIELRAFLFKPDKEEMEAAEEPETQLTTQPASTDPVRSESGASGANGATGATPSAKGF